MSSSDSRFKLSSRELTLIFLFWTSLATLSAVNRLWGARDFGFGRVISPAGPIALGYLEAWTWAVATPLIFWLSSQTELTRARWARVAILLLAGIAIAISVYVVLDLARAAIMPLSPRRRGGGAGGLMPLREIGHLRFLNQLIVYVAVLAAGFARVYFLRDQHRQREAIVLTSQAAHLQAQLAEARLDALRMQINPHFLFNTLHAVSALVERDPAGVRRMIARLSELLRHTIESSATDEVPLRDELAFLRRYVEIMEIRFQGKLQVSASAPDDTLEAMVPNLILQPIVENALEHGVSRTSGEARIEITARREGERLLLTVRDNGPGLESGIGSGVGLKNTRARLEQLYGEEAELSLESAPGSGVVASIALPYHTTADGRFEGRLDD